MGNILFVAFFKAFVAFAAAIVITMITGMEIITSYNKFNATLKSQPLTFTGNSEKSIMTHRLGVNTKKSSVINLTLT